MMKIYNSHTAELHNVEAYWRQQFPPEPSKVSQDNIHGWHATMKRCPTAAWTYGHPATVYPLLAYDRP